MKIKLSESKRIIVKIGSSIMDADSLVLKEICKDISNLMSEKKEIILVTSGAISQGMRQMNIQDRPKDIKKLQSLAAIGQQKLMFKYEKIFTEHNLIPAQVLITHGDINDRVRYLNIKGTLEELLSNNIIPIINENDVVSTEEIKLGDNDNLASMISNLVDADLLIILTDQKGMYDKNPDHYENAELIHTINVDNLNTLDADSGTASNIGTGGFATKIQAVKRAALSNTYTLIASGFETNVLENIFEDSHIGTLFIPNKKRVSAKKQWLDTTDNKGSVIIDDGACKALLNNKSLLFVGVCDIEGAFQKGDVIQCKNKNLACIAKGITNYSSNEVLEMKGKSMNEIEAKHSDEFNKELIHADSLIVIET